MTKNHSFPIVPPPELVRQWLSEEYERGLAADHVAIQAARWGSDQELEACCEVLAEKCFEGQANLLRGWRRPKPPSLKQQAMQVFLEAGYTLDGRMELEPEDIDIIHRALEQLND